MIIHSLNLFGQWTQLNSGTTETLNCVFFTDDNTGYAAGSGSTTATLIKTIDGGTTWNPLSINTVNEIYSLSFGSSNVGYALTKQSELFKTTDAGSTWNNIYNFGVFDGHIFFQNADTGFVANGDGTIYKTIDGGTTWSSVTMSSFSNPTSIYFPTTQVGYVVTYWGKVAKTNDMGATWTILNQATSKPLWDVFFTTIDTGYAVGGDGVSSLILKTTDGGNSWTVQTTTPTTSSSHNAVFFTSSDTGYLGNTSIYLTNNAGAVWNSMTTPKQIKDIYFPSSSVGYAVGYNGAILKLNTTTTGIDNNFTSLPNINPFPNPAGFQVSIPTSQEKGSIKIFDLAGNEIDEFKINESNLALQIDVSNYKNGIYFFSVSSEQKIINVGRFVVNR